MQTEHPECGVPDCDSQALPNGVCSSHHNEAHGMSQSMPHKMDIVVQETRIAQKREDAARKAKYASQIKNTMSDGWDGHATKYGRAAWDPIITELVNCGEGNRNNMLFKSSARLGQLVAGGHLLESAVEESLIIAGLATGLHRADVLNTVRRGVREGMKRPDGPKGV